MASDSFLKETVMSEMTEKMTKAARTTTKPRRTPKSGDRFRCHECGMELEITADCHCDQPDHVHLQCCGQEMEKV